MRFLEFEWYTSWRMVTCILSFIWDWYKNLKTWVFSTRKLMFLMVNFSRLWTKPLSFSCWFTTTGWTPLVLTWRKRSCLGEEGAAIFKQDRRSAGKASTQLGQGHRETLELSDLGQSAYWPQVILTPVEGQRFCPQCQKVLHQKWKLSGWQDSSFQVFLQAGEFVVVVESPADSELIQYIYVLYTVHLNSHAGTIQYWP